MRVWIVPVAFFASLIVFFTLPVFPQDSTQKGSSSSSKTRKAPKAPVKSGLDDGKFSGGVYRNSSLGLTCKVPVGWVLRTDEMNARDSDEPQTPSPQGSPSSTGEGNSGRVLLAAF